MLMSLQLLIRVTAYTIVISSLMMDVSMRGQGIRKIPKESNLIYSISQPMRDKSNLT